MVRGQRSAGFLFTEGGDTNKNIAMRSFVIQSVTVKRFLSLLRLFVFLKVLGNLPHRQGRFGKAVRMIW
ncbi:unnamed protein product [Penicillium camemberti]|uniref:Str. FM013 n=1 Tax=Penicillium camemberti (strain FM 013) TaxID=1429867 RepID=A0A0G4P291_PENC3|nr:unnamed protein product [Penicillium camemberti]